MIQKAFKGYMVARLNNDKYLTSPLYVNIKINNVFNTVNKLQIFPFY